MWILFESALRGTAKSLGQNCGGETVHVKMQENLLRCNCYISFDTYCLLFLVFYHIVLVLVPAVLIPAAADVSDKHFPLVRATGRAGQTMRIGKANPTGICKRGQMKQLSLSVIYQLRRPGVWRFELCCAI